MESLLKDLQKHVECSICLDIYKQPKTITCLHTFCCQCLETYARASHRERKFRCPECQAQIDLPEENRFDSLPTSSFHNSLLSLLAVRRCGDGSGEMTCSQCRKNTSQMYYCFDCGWFMCPDCNNSHEMVRASFEGHKVTAVKEFKAEDYEALMKRQPFCSQQFHEKEITKFFCFSCNVCACHMCIATEHRESHKVDSLDKAALQAKSIIMAGAEMIKGKVDELSEEIRQFKETSSELEKNFADAQREVSETAKRMVEKIKESEREALAFLEETLEARQENVTLAEQEGNFLLKQMMQAAKFALEEKPYSMAGAEMNDEKVAELKTESGQFGKTSSELEKNFADAQREVSETAERMIEKIRESEREALAFLEATHEARQENVTLAEQETNSLLKQMMQAAEFAENLAEKSSSSDIMRNKDTLKQRNEELRGVEVPKHHESTFIKFSAASVETLTVGVIETTEKKALDDHLVPVAAQEDQWSCRLM